MPGTLLCSFQRFGFGIPRMRIPMSNIQGTVGRYDYVLLSLWKHLFSHSELSFMISGTAHYSDSWLRDLADQRHSDEISRG